MGMIKIFHIYVVSNSQYIIRITKKKNEYLFSNVTESFYRV